MLTDMEKNTYLCTYICVLYSVNGLTIIDITCIVRRSPERTRSRTLQRGGCFQ